MPDSTKYVFAGFYWETLAGIIVYWMWAWKSQYKAILPEIQAWCYLELTRLWSPDWMPKNTESRLIWWSMRMLPNEIELVVSFADPWQNHHWIIYQATNFHFCWETSWGKCLVTSDWHTQHTRLIWIYKMRHPELKEKSIKDIMEIYGWTYKKNHPKYRYVYLRGRYKKRNTKIINYQIKEYPNK